MMRKRQLCLLLLALGTSQGQRGLRILQYKRSRPGERATERNRLLATDDTLTEEGTDATIFERHSDEPDERNVFVTSVNENPASSPSVAPEPTITESPTPSEGGESNVTLIPTLSPAPSAINSTDSPTVDDFGNSTEAPTVDFGNVTEAPTVDFGNVTEAPTLDFGNMTETPDDLGNSTEAPSMVGADGEPSETPDVDARLSLRQSSNTAVSSSVEAESTVSRWRGFFPSFSDADGRPPYVWVAPKSSAKTLETGDEGDIDRNP